MKYWDNRLVMVTLISMLFIGITLGFVAGVTVTYVGLAKVVESIKIDKVEVAFNETRAIDYAHKLAKEEQGVK